MTGKPTASSSKLVSRGARRGLVTFAALFSGFVLLFYGTIFLGAFTRVWGYDFSHTLDHFSYAFGVGLGTIRDTLIVALWSTPLSGFLGMLIAFLVVRTSFPGKGLMEFTSILNFAVPGTVIGIGYILAFNRPPLMLMGTLAILVLNFVFRYIPVGIQSGIAVLRQIDPSIEEAAQNLGADRITTFRKVTLPIIAPAFFSGLVFAFVRAMTAISAAIFLVSANWNLLTVQILNQVGSGRLGVAAAFSVILVVIVVAAMAVIARLVPGRTGGMAAIQIQEDNPVKLRIDSLVKDFGSFDDPGGLFRAVDSVSLEVDDGELVTLLGPSGCGKTTLLRMIAGFEDPTSGDIFFGEQRMNDVPPNRRNAAMVFQSYAIFPHLNVRDNIAFGLRLRKLTDREIRERTEQVVDLVGLGGMEARQPSQLSGGHSKRVPLPGRW